MLMNAVQVVEKMNRLAKDGYYFQYGRVVNLDGREYEGDASVELESVYFIPIELGWPLAEKIVTEARDVKGFSMDLEMLNAAFRGYVGENDIRELTRQLAVLHRVKQEQEVVDFPENWIAAESIIVMAKAGYRLDTDWRFRHVSGRGMPLPALPVVERLDHDDECNRLVADYLKDRMRYLRIFFNECGETVHTLSRRLAETYAPLLDDRLIRRGA